MSRRRARHVRVPQLRWSGPFPNTIALLQAVPILFANGAIGVLAPTVHSPLVSIFRTISSSHVYPRGWPPTSRVSSVSPRARLPIASPPCRPATPTRQALTVNSIPHASQASPIPSNLAATSPVSQTAPAPTHPCIPPCPRPIPSRLTTNRKLVQHIGLYIEDNSETGGVDILVCIRPHCLGPLDPLPDYGRLCAPDNRGPRTSRCVTCRRHTTSCATRFARLCSNPPRARLTCAR